MSDEIEIAKAVKEQAAALHQANAVNAASVAQRENDAARLAKREASGWDANFRMTALNGAVKLHPQGSPAEVVLEDAATFLAWLKGDCE